MTPARRRSPSRSAGRQVGRPERDVVIVGRRPAIEAVRSGRATELLVADNARSTDGLREVAEVAGSSGVPVLIVDEDRIESLAAGERHQGVAARVTLPRALNERQLGTRNWSEEAVVVVLDGVTDPHNVGAVARSAEAAGAEALILRRRRSGSMGPAAVRSSAGALLHLPAAEVANLPRALSALKEQGFWVVGLDADASSTVEGDRPAGRLAMVLGSEGEGLSRLVAQTCDELLAIPLRGAVGSLNVSVAAGVALFTYAIRGKGKRRT